MELEELQQVYQLAIKEFDATQVSDFVVSEDIDNNNDPGFPDPIKELLHNTLMKVMHTLICYQLKMFLAYQLLQKALLEEITPEEVRILRLLLREK